MRTVRFDGKDSWADFGLIRSGAEIEAPDPKTSTVDIDGADGVLDLTDYFGETLYKNRKIDITLSALPQGPLENVFVNTDGVIQPEIELKDNGKGGFTVYGQTRQNLWSNPANGTVNGITVVGNSNGSVSLYGTATEDTWKYSSTFVLKPGATYTLSVDKLTNASNETFYVEFRNADDIGTMTVAIGATLYGHDFVVPNDTAYAIIGIRCKSGQTLSGTYRVMFNEGSEAEPWCPPGLNSVESLEIVTAGKNLFPALEGQTTGGINVSVDDSGIILDGTATGNIFLGIDSTFRANVGTELTLSLGNEKTSSGISLHVLDKAGGTPLIGTHSNVVMSTTTATLTDNSTCCYLRIQSGTVLDSYKVAPQIEIGDSATGYESPSGVTTTGIDLQGNALCSLPDGTRDELRVDESGAVTLVKRCNPITLPSEASSWVDTGEDEAKRYRYALSPLAKSGYVPDAIRCDVLPPRAESTAEAQTGTNICATNNGVYVTIGSGETAETVANVCGGGTLIYKLATEQEIDLGYIPMEQFDRSFHALFSRLQNAIHGKRCRIELSEDPGFYYMGRVTVDKWKTNEAVGEISVSCDCDPYKLRQGVTRRIVTGDGTAQTVTFQNLRKKVVPVFNTNGTAWTIKQGTNTFTANGSSWSDGKLYFSQGANELTITGTGKLEVTYQERGL